MKVDGKVSGFAFPCYLDHPPYSSLSAAMYISASKVKAKHLILLPSNLQYEPWRLQGALGSRGHGNLTYI
jgi:hypothetical protein